MQCRSMIEPLIQRAVRHPDRTALVYQDQTLSYAELLEQVNRFARALSRLGVGAADRVGYVLENRLEIVAVFYAIQAIGAVAVPINIRSIAPEIACLSRAVGAKAVVYSKLRREQVAEAEKEMGRVELICVDPLPGGQDLPTLAEDESSAEFSGPRATTALSRIQFTGGSTGTPKGAMRTHQADLINIDGTAQACFLTGAEPKTVLIQCPLEHHGGHAWLTASIAFGATVVICGAFDPQRVLQAIERHRVTHAIMLPPTTYLRLMEYPDIDRYDLSSLRVLQTSAGAASKHFVAQAYRHFPNCLINYGWGQTESGLGSTLVLSRGLLAKDDPKLGSIGVPMEHVEMRLADESGNAVPVGEVGECLLRSPAVMSGYWEQPELTAEALPGDGWLRTGDMMSQDADGYYYLCHRKKDIIKTGGENVFAAEVERVVAQHPAVRDCAVYGIVDSRFGEAVAASVELQPGAQLALKELQAWTCGHIASFKKPLALRVVASLGRDYSGKVDKHRLGLEHEASLQGINATTDE